MNIVFIACSFAYVSYVIVVARVNFFGVICMSVCVILLFYLIGGLFFSVGWCVRIFMFVLFCIVASIFSWLYFIGSDAMCAYRFSIVFLFVLMM